MSFATSRLARPLPGSNFHCTNLCRPSRSPLSSAVARSARTPTKAVRNTAASASENLPPIRRASKPPPRPESPTLSSVRTRQNLQKHNLARILYESGETLIYQAPSHAGFLAATFLTGTMCFIGVVSTFSTDLWKSSEVPWWINAANRMGIICFTFLGGWIILRATRHITSLKLIRQGNTVKMLVTVRRMIPLPLVPSKKIITDPVDFILPSRMVAQLAMPSWMDRQGPEITGTFPSRILKRISLALWTFFAGMRKVFTHEGFLDVKIEGTSGLWKLDSAGSFAQGGRNLLNIVSYEME